MRVLCVCLCGVCFYVVCLSDFGVCVCVCFVCVVFLWCAFADYMCFCLGVVFCVYL